jgi:hypothetical protein
MSGVKNGKDGFGAGDPSRALEVEMPRSRLTSVLVVAAPMDVAQDHERFGYHG